MLIFFPAHEVFKGRSIVIAFLFRIKKIKVEKIDNVNENYL